MIISFIIIENKRDGLCHAQGYIPKSQERIVVSSDGFVSLTDNIIKAVMSRFEAVECVEIVERIYASKVCFWIVKVTFKEASKTKSLWLENGFVLSKEGQEVRRRINDTIGELYENLLDEGYLPHELKEAFFTSVFFKSTFIDAMRC